MPELFIRLTPYGPSELCRVDEIVRNLNPTSYCLSQEEATRRHYHLYFNGDYTIERIRYRLKSQIDAQVYISGKDVQDKIRTIAYTIKDGNYTHHNLDVNTFLMAQQVTFKKKTFDDSVKELKQIQWSSIEELVDAVIDIYIEFNKKIYEQHLSALVKTIYISQSNKFREHIKGKILSLC